MTKRQFRGPQSQYVQDSGLNPSLSDSVVEAWTKLCSPHSTPGSREGGEHSSRDKR